MISLAYNFIEKTKIKAVNQNENTCTITVTVMASRGFVLGQDFISEVQERITLDSLQDV